MLHMSSHPTWPRLWINCWPNGAMPFVDESLDCQGARTHWNGAFGRRFGGADHQEGRAPRCRGSVRQGSGPQDADRNFG